MKRLFLISFLFALSLCIAMASAYSAHPSVSVHVATVPHVSVPTYHPSYTPHPIVGISHVSNEPIVARSPPEPRLYSTNQQYYHPVPFWWWFMPWRWNQIHAVPIGGIKTNVTTNSSN